MRWMEVQVHSFLGTYKIRAWPGLHFWSGMMLNLGLRSGELQGDKNHFGGLDPYEYSLELTLWEPAKINSVFPSCNKQVSRVTLELK